ncbi:unnamed protein product [Schistosoma curassoni]|uniref:ChSh domain-containing protein n=1 Tax=Schistosoma curassoni TaxID=6186 RepID=A0A183KQN2_9TREM|nr:unnamed protein product [Schistosoma curassoni]
MNNNEKSNYKKINYLDLLQDAQENCVVQARELPLYPECFSKIECVDILTFQLKDDGKLLLCNKVCFHTRLYVRFGEFRYVR